MSFKNFVNSHSSEILTGFSIAGMVVSVIMAIKATPRAMKKIEKRKEELGVEKLGVLETVKTAGPCYIMTGITMGLATACVVIPVSNEMKKGELLATGLMITSEQLKTFEEKTKEVIGEKKVNEIKDEIAKEKCQPVVVTGSKNGEKIFMDTLVNCEFYLKGVSDLDILEKDVELDIINYNFVSVNDWLSRIHVPQVDPAIGDLGWGPGNGFGLHRTWIELDNGEPCCLVSHTTPPLPRKQAEGCWGA